MAFRRHTSTGAGGSSTLTGALSKSDASKRADADLLDRFKSLKAALTDHATLVKHNERLHEEEVHLHLLQKANVQRIKVAETRDSLDKAKLFAVAVSHAVREEVTDPAVFSRIQMRIAQMLAQHMGDVGR